jgi:hypothetical protein
MTFRYRGEHRLGSVRVPQIPLAGAGLDTDVQYLGGLDEDAAAAKAQEMADKVLASWSSKVARPPVTDEELGEVAKEIAP